MAVQWSNGSSGMAVYCMYSSLGVWLHLGGGGDGRGGGCGVGGGVSGASGRLLHP